MIKKLMCVLTAFLSALTLCACLSGHSQNYDTSQSLQRARLPKVQVSKVCNMADILSSKHLNSSQSIAIIAVALEHDDGLNPGERYNRSDQMGLFQTPAHKLKPFAKRRHLQVKNSSLQIDYVLSQKGMKLIRKDKRMSPKTLAFLFDRYVLNSKVIDRYRLDQNVNKLEDK